MSDFFAFPEPEPEPERAQRHVQPPWMAAPRGWLPGVVATELLLARDEDDELDQLVRDL